LGLGLRSGNSIEERYIAILGGPVHFGLELGKAGGLMSAITSSSEPLDPLKALETTDVPIIKINHLRSFCLLLYYRFGSNWIFFNNVLM
jgi:hypothetical protein